MSKPAEITHDYNADKDRLKISIRGYALTKKKDRNDILKRLILAVERSPARLISSERKRAKTGKPGKRLPGSRREVRQFDEERD